MTSPDSSSSVSYDRVRPASRISALLFGVLVLLLGLWMARPLATRAQPEQVADRFSSPVPAPSDLGVYSDGSGTRLCFGGDAALDRKVLFCYDGSTLRQISNLAGTQPTGGPGQGSNPIKDFAVYDDGAGPKLYFQAKGSPQEVGKELYVSDGSTVRLAADVNPGGGNSKPRDLTVANLGSGPKLYYSAFDGTDRELHVYDGTGDTEIDVNSNGSAAPTDLTVYDGTLYYSARVGGERELHAYDGQSDSLVADIAETGGSGVTNLTVADLGSGQKKLYYNADDGASGRELHAFNGTRDSLVADVNSGAGDSAPTGLTVYDDGSGAKLYYNARDGSSGEELHAYDGTRDSLIADVNSGAGSSSPRELTVYEGRLYYSADDGTDRELHAYDGTRDTEVADVNAGAAGSRPSALTVADLGSGPKLYFRAIDGQSAKLHVYDGSSVTAFTTTNNAFSLPGRERATYDGVLYFTADAEGAGTELWQYDGATVSMAADINPGPGGSGPKDLTVYDGRLYYSATDGTDRELHAFDGQRDTEIVDINGSGSSKPEDLTVADLGSGPTLYYGANDGTDRELHAFDGRSDTEVADVNGSGSSSPRGFTVADLGSGRALYYRAFDDINGNELHAYDGTEDRLVADIAPGSGSGAPYDLTVADLGSGTTLYYGADDGTDTELHAYDGERDTEVADIDPDFSGTPELLTVYDDGSGATLYYRAGDGDADGDDLRAYDGQRDTEVSSLSPQDLKVFGGRLYFTAVDDTRGVEPRGLVGSSVRSLDVAPGPISGGGRFPVAYDDGGGTDLYVIATDGVTGFELYRSPFSSGQRDYTAPAPPTGVVATTGPGEVRLRWDANNEADLDGYRLYRDTGPIDATAAPIDSTQAGTPSFTDTSLSAGTTYRYRVTAVDTAGNESGLSDEVQATPSTPPRVTALRPSSGAPGTAVRIYGTRFAPSATGTTVRFGATRAPVDSATANVIYATVPSGTVPGSVPVSVATRDTTVTANTPFGVLTGGSRRFTPIDADLQGVRNSDSDWGDFDGDGDLDLILTGNTMAVIYENRGNGRFRSIGAGLTGVRNGSSASWGDYNGDGRPDLVVTGRDGPGDPTATIYRNEGGGSFAPIEAGLTPVSESSTDWGDVDGDGDLDLVVTGSANAGPSTTLYRNQGNGDFQAVDVGLPDVDFGTARWGDYNDDGRLDLLVTGRTGTGPTTALYRNDGDGTFSPVGADLPPLQNSAADWGDVDDDGDLDLVLAGENASRTPTASIYENRGRGTFARLGASLAGVTSRSRVTADWGDVNGDGRLDLVVTGNGGNGPTAALYRNDGNGTFSAVGDDLIGVDFGSASWGDYDGDGALDLVITGDDGPSKTARIYRNLDPAPPRSLRADAGVDSVRLRWDGAADSDRTEYRIYRSTTPIDSTAGPSALSVYDTVPAPDTAYTDPGVATDTTYHYRVTTVDASGDESGFSEEATATPRFRLSGFVPTSGIPGTAVRVSGSGFPAPASETTVRLLDSTGTATPASVADVGTTTLTVTVPEGVPSPARVAVDVGNGRRDTTAARFTPLRADAGSRSFRAVGAGLAGLQVGDAAWGDYDQDGDPDLIVTGRDSTGTPRTILYRNDGGGQFTDVEAGLIPLAESTAEWGDVDGDGDLDLLVSGLDGSRNQTKIYRNTGGSFTPIGAGLETSREGDAAWGDYDNDGDLDVAVTGFSPHIYRNDGNGRFVPVRRLFTGGAAWGDYDEDGDLDLVVNRTDGAPVLYRYDGSDTFTAVTDAGLSGTGGFDVAWADFDQDGDLDLAATGTSDQALGTALYRNQGDGTFTAVDAGLTPTTGGYDDHASLDWGDYDGDGDPDLVLSGSGGTGPATVLYRNDGGGAFTEVNGGFTNVNRGTIAWTDYNGDGVLDLFATGRTAAGPPVARLYRSTSTPPPPSGLSSRGVADSVQLRWNTVNAAKYRIYRATAPIDSAAGPSGLAPYDSVSAPSATYADTDVTIDTTYHYRVTAVDGTGDESGFSQGVVAVPGFRVSGVQPTSATPGTAVRLFGNSFASAPSDNTVTLVDSTGATTSAPVTEARRTALTVEMPSGVGGPARVAVARNDGVADTTAARLTPIDSTLGGRSFEAVGAGLTGVQTGELDFTQDGTASWGDYDRDGDPDLLLTGRNASGTPVTALYRNDGGSFTKVNAGLPDVDGEAEWSDYDQDGDLDLAFAGQREGFPSPALYRNEGGTFTRVNAGLLSASGTRGSIVAWADYNRDGMPDLLSSSPETALTVYRNRGNGTFAAVASLLGPGFDVDAAAWGDYDRDDDPDLLVVGESSDNSPETILYRNDSGSFTPVEPGLPDVSGDAAWTDYDADGDLDLALVGTTDRREIARIYRNDGAGTFTPIDAGLRGVSERPAAAWGDYDGDGDPDLVVTGEDASVRPVVDTTLVYRNNGGDTFVPINGGLSGVDRAALAWGDYNTDGALDLVVTGRQGRADDRVAATVYRNRTGMRPPSSLSAVARIDSVQLRWNDVNAGVARYRVYRSTAPIDSAAGPSSRAPVDSVRAPATAYTDADVSPDTTYYYRVTAVGEDGTEGGFSRSAPATPGFRVAGVSPASGAPGTRVRLFGNSFAPSAADPTVTLTTGDNAPTEATVTEARRTALTVEVPGGVASPSRVTVSRKDGRRDTVARRFTALRPDTGVPAFEGVKSPLPSLDFSAADWGDYDNDGDLDLVLAGIDGASGATVTTVYRNDGGTFTDVEAGLTGVSSIHAYVEWGDYDQDGDLDLVLSGYDSNGDPETALYRNDGEGTFTEVNVGLTDVAYGEGAWGDYDGDGDPDLIVTGYGAAGAVTALYRNDGDGSFTKIDAGLADVGGSKPAWGDYDRDGDLDLLVTGYGDYFGVSTVLYRNDGDGSFTPVDAGLPDVGDSAVDWGDYDGDGDLDLLLTSYSVSDIYRNDGGDFTNVEADLKEFSLGSAAWADADGDGDLDLLLSGYAEATGNATTTLYRNDGDDGFTAVDAGFAGVAEGDVTWGDYNGDGVLDLLATGYSTTLYQGRLDAPSAPGPLSTTAYTDSIRVRWSSSGGGTAAYRVYRSTTAIDSAAGPSALAPYDTVAAPATVYTDTSVTDGTTYHYRVSAVGATGSESAFSPEVQAAPAEALTVWPGDTDNSGRVDQGDALPLGLHWHRTGPARDSTGCAFRGRTASAWPIAAATYADANGDGVVDQADVLCIGMNWHRSHAPASARPALYAAVTPPARPRSTGDAPRPTDQRPAAGRRDALNRTASPHRSQGKSRSTPPRSSPPQKPDFEPPTTAERTSPRAEGRLLLDAPDIASDSTFWVGLRVRGAKKLLGVSAALHYDPAVVSVEAVRPKDWLGAEALSQTHVDETAGIVGMGLVRPRTAEPRGGSHLLARLRLRWTAEPEAGTTLRLKRARAGLSSGRMLRIETGADATVRPHPATFNLHDNYPNPFQEQTTIRYDLPEPTDVRLVLYDVLGRQVATLVDRKQEAGQKTVTLEADRLASSVYFYRLTAGDQTATGKMTVVR